MTTCYRTKSLCLSFRHFYFLILTFYLLLLFGCGYTIQTKANLPFDTIAVGKLENKTYEPKLQDMFSRSLAETFAEYGFKVSSSARYRLEGEITKFELEPLTEQNLVAAQYKVVIKANFRLIDTSTRKSVPLVADSPFITYFSSTERLENVLAQKELSTVSALKNLSQEIVRIITYNTPKNFAYLLFTASDIKNLENLILKLHEPKDPVSIYLRQQLSPNTCQMLHEYVNAKIPPDKIKPLIVNDLNTIVQGVSIFDEKRFAHIALTQETLDLIKQNPSGLERMRLNRLLIQEAYPDEIAGLNRITEKQ
ncbi:hypothetical protein A45J_0940 [hot springs metagenome]|uniref:Lipoprotein n=1 Tax=hot springs metagenome TaxID=433727 RepID=A0A5J4KVI0_9ZZZZ